MLFLRVITSIEMYGGWLAPLVPLFPYLSKFCFPVALMAEHGTIYLTILVTLNRYFSVCRPYEVSDLCSKRTARQHIAIVAAFAILYNLPRFFEYNLIYGPPSPPPGPPSATFTDVPGTTTSLLNTTELTFFVNQSDVNLQLSQQQGQQQSDVKDGGWMMVRTVPSDMVQNIVYQVVYMNVLYCLVMFLVPLASLIFLNYRLIATLRATTRKRRQLLPSTDAGAVSRNGSSVDRGRRGGSGHSQVEIVRSVSSLRGYQQQSPPTHQQPATRRRSRSEDDVTMTLIVVVLTFVVCQTPALVTQILHTFADDRARWCGGMVFYYERLSDLLVVANSAINFIIYCFCSRRFRRHLLALLCSNTRGNVLPEATSCASQMHANAAVNRLPRGVSADNGHGPPSRTPSFAATANSPLNKTPSQDLTRSPSCASVRRLSPPAANKNTSAFKKQPLTLSASTATAATAADAGLRPSMGLLSADSSNYYYLSPVQPASLRCDLLANDLELGRDLIKRSNSAVTFSAHIPSRTSVQLQLCTKNKPILVVNKQAAI